VIALRDIADAWNAFFFAPEPASTIALFRMLFGGLLLVNGLLFVRDVRLWVGPRGVLSHEQYCKLYGHSRFTLLRYLPATDTSALAVLAVHLIAVVCLTVGFMTRSSAAVAFLTLMSLQHRNPFVCYGADDVMRVLCFLLIFSRAGDAYSVDRWRAARSGEIAVAGTAWCTRLMQLQVSTIYLQAFLSKFSGTSWLDGTAVYYAVEAPRYRRCRLPRFARTLFWSRIATWGTIAIEFALGPLIWIRELRTPVLIAGVALHLGMEVFMNLQLFSATMIVSILLFLDPHSVERMFDGGWWPW
jgi:uncharacterized membrane protein YphA (DoxX/SURF4 family)